jgi:putative tryptophan/tyrosine transport system substrate-binding protein
MRRRQFIALSSAAVVAGRLDASAQPKALPVVGVLSSLSPGPVARQVEVFRQALAEGGYEEGKTVSIEYRWAEGDYRRLPELAADLVKLEVSVIVTVGGDPAARAAKAATSKIPIVFMVGRNPKDFGLVASVNRPGGNATGVNFFVSETESKRIELLREVIPAAKSFAVLMNPQTADAATQLEDFKAAAAAFKMRLKIENAANDDEIKQAFASIAESKVDAVLVAADPFLNNRRDLIVSMAADRAIPTVYPLRDYAAAGGLVSYGASLTDGYHQVGIYAAKILRGANPGDLPVIQPTKFELVINLKTAQALGLTIPPTLIARADEVIE